MLFRILDDIWLPNKLEMQVDYLDSHPDITMVYADFGVINSDGNLINKNLYKSLNLYRPSGYIFRDLLMFNFIPTLTVLVKKEFFKQIGLFEEDLILVQDYEMWVKNSKKF